MGTISASPPRPQEDPLCERERPYLDLSRIHAQAGALHCLVLSRLGGSISRWWRYSFESPFKTSVQQKRDSCQKGKPQGAPEQDP